MQLLPNGQVQIKNSQTGETRVVNPNDLPNYGVGVLNQYANLISQQQPQQTAQPQVQQQQAPVQAPQQSPQDLATTIGNTLGNILSGASKPARLVAQAGADLPSIVNALITGKPITSPAPNLGAFGLSPAEQKQVEQHPVQEGLKNAADAASYAIPFGKAAEGAGAVGKILSGVLAPGAAVGALQGVSQDNATPASVAGNAVLGAGGAGLVGAAAPALGKILGGGGDALDAAGNQIIKGQYAGPKGVADANQLGATISQLKNYGVNSFKDIATIAPKVTGDTGIITQLTRDAVSKANPVDLGGVLNIGKDLVNNEPLVSASAGNKFNDMLDKGINAMGGGEGEASNATKGNSYGTGELGGAQYSILHPGGNLNITNADPGKAFDFIQSLQSKAASLAHGATDESRSLAKVYQGVANELTDRLYQGAGADKALTSSTITPEALDKIKQISPQLAKDVSQVKTVGQLRSLAAPFVRGSKLAQATENAKSNELPGDLATAGGFGALEAILGGGVSPATLPAALGGYLAKKAVTSDTGQSIISKLLTGGGEAGKAGGAAFSALGDNPVLSYLTGQSAARKGIALGQTGALPNQIPNNANTTNNQTNNSSGNGVEQVTSSPSGNSISPTVNGNQTGQTMTITPQMVQNAYLHLAPAQADRVKSAYDAQFGGATNELNPVETSNLNKQIDDLVGTFKKMNVVQKINPLDPTNQDLQAQRAAITLEIIRSSAGRVSKQELDQAFNNFLNPATTNPVAQGNALKALVNNKVNPNVGAQQ